MRSSRSSNHQKFAHAEEIDPYHEDRYYEEMRDEPPRRRWPRRLTALMLIAVGAYAYRTYYIEPASTQTPPVITAEETPGRVIPADSDRQSGKLIQERVGALESRERMFSREEPSIEPKTTEPKTTDAKRITTLPIRPDGTEASAGRFASPPPSTSTPATPSQPRLAQPAARGAPASDASPAPRIAAASSPATAANAA